MLKMRGNILYLISGIFGLIAAGLVLLSVIGGVVGASWLINSFMTNVL